VSIQVNKAAARGWQKRVAFGRTSPGAAIVTTDGYLSIQMANGRCRVARILLPTFAALGMVLLCGCSKSDPPIANELPKPIFDDTYFDERVRQRFPVGTAADKLVAELRSESFIVDEFHDLSGRYQHLARYEISRLVCSETWDIFWSVQGGKISAIKGSYRNYCL
jgi:hypothetical protein